MQLYRLKDKKGNILYEGSYAECRKREVDIIEYVGVVAPKYRATNNKGLNVEGTMKELSKILNENLINLYNYTRYTRKSDGLHLKKVGKNA